MGCLRKFMGFLRVTDFLRGKSYPKPGFEQPSQIHLIVAVLCQGAIG